MHHQPAVTMGDAYTGVDNLEVMAVAVKYRRFLARSVAELVVSDPGVTLLDFGAGTGTHARDLRDLGFDVCCIEIDRDLRSQLDAEGFSTFASIADLGGRTFPLVYTFNVLEHIVDDRAALDELFAATAPGGTLLVYVPALPSLFSSMDRKVGHLRRYRRRQLERLIRTAGFNITRSTYVDSLGWFATMLYKMVGNDRGDIGTRSVGLYDRFAFPVSRALDRLTGNLFGKNLLVVATRPQGDPA